MIRLIRKLSVVLFVVSVVLFVVSGIYIARNSDDTSPVIHMEETEIVVSVEATEEELMQGVTAEDNKDGDVTDSLMVEKMGMFFEEGKRKITINAFDSNNNVTKTERIVTYSDYTSPKIVLQAPLRIAVNEMDELLDLIKVEDCLDGNITENLQITPTENVTITTMPGEYAIKLTATNSVGDIVEIPVTLELYDYSLEAIKPQILLTDYLVYTPVGQPIDPNGYLKGVQVMDTEYIWDEITVEGEIPYSKSEVIIDNPVDFQTPGTYEILYSLENGGIVSRVRLIVVVEE